MFDRIGRWWTKNAPSRESLERSAWLRPFAHRILEPGLWRFTRRSVPRGVALGLLVGIFLMIPGIQMAAAALLALPCRANLPVAVAVTLFSNPATTPLILYASLYIGNRFVHSTADLATVSAMIEQRADLAEWVAWIGSAAAPALLVGLFVIAIVTASLGYLLASVGWGAWIWRKWARRTRVRSQGSPPDA